MDHSVLRDLTKRLRTFTAVAFLRIARPLDGIPLKSGEALVFLAVHHHGDLMLHTSAGYRHTGAADVAQLTGLSESTASGHLAELARRDWLTRIEIGARRVGYRPVRAAEEWLA